jgi:spore germination protein GerM
MEVINLSTQTFSKGIGVGTNSSNPGAKVVLTGTIGDPAKVIRVTVESEGREALDEFNDFTIGGFSLTLEGS